MQLRYPGKVTKWKPPPGHASMAARIRWARVRDIQAAQVNQIGTAALKAYHELLRDIDRTGHPLAPELSRHARRLLASFANLWELASTDLHPDIRARMMNPREESLKVERRDDDAAG